MLKNLHAILDLSCVKSLIIRLNLTHFDHILVITDVNYLLITLNFNTFTPYFKYNGCKRSNCFLKSF